MKILFTNSVQFNTPQPFAYKSLGNYVSSSEVPNDLLNALFDSISEYSKSLADKSVYRIIALCNDGETTMSNFKMWLETIENQDSDVLDIQLATYQIGFQEAIADSCGDIVIPTRLPSEYSKPMQITMYDAEGEGNAVSLPNLENGMFIGIALSRTISKSAVDCDQISDSELQSIYIDKTISLATKEGVELHFSFDEV